MCTHTRQASFFSSASQDLPFEIAGAPRPSSGGPVGGGGGASGADWSVPPPQSVGVGGVGMGPFAGGMGGAAHQNNQQHHMHAQQNMQQQAPQQQRMPQPQPQMGGAKVMSLADIEAQMLVGSQQRHPQQNQHQQSQQQQVFLMQWTALLISNACTGVVFSIL